jgi:hypothetical protein
VTVANEPVVCLNVLYSKTLTSFLISTDVGMKFPEGINTAFTGEFVQQLSNWVPHYG